MGMQADIDSLDQLAIARVVNALCDSERWHTWQGIDLPTADLRRDESESRLIILGNRRSNNDAGADDVVPSVRAIIDLEDSASYAKASLRVPQPFRCEVLVRLTFEQDTRGGTHAEELWEFIGNYSVTLAEVLGYSGGCGCKGTCPVVIGSASRVELVVPREPDDEKCFRATFTLVVTGDV